MLKKASQVYIVLLEWDAGGPQLNVISVNQKWEKVDMFLFLRFNIWLLLIGKGYADVPIYFTCLGFKPKRKVGKSSSMVYFFFL